MLVAVSITAWGLRLVSRAPSAPVNTVAAGETVIAGGDLTRVFGAPVTALTEAAPPPEIASRLKLTGVVAPRAPDTEGVALIAVDGKMPRAYVVGAKLDDTLVLTAVGLRSASIGNGTSAAPVVLELPAPPVAATGTLPALGESGSSESTLPPGAPPVFQGHPGTQRRGLSAD